MTTMQQVRAVSRRTLTFTLDAPPDVTMIRPGDGDPIVVTPARLEVIVTRIDGLTDYRAQGVTLVGPDNLLTRTFRRGAPPAGRWANDLPEWLLRVVDAIEAGAYRPVAHRVCEVCGRRVEQDDTRRWSHAPGVPEREPHQARLATVPA